MNSQEARAALTADPRRSTLQLEDAIGRDPALATLRATLLTANAALAAAFADVAPPAGLADRIILRVRYRRRSRLAMAGAAAVMAIVVSFFALDRERTAPISLAMLDHVIESTDELADDAGVPAPDVAKSLAALGVGYVDAGFRVRHLGECIVAGRVGRHLVVSTPAGLVSFLILPRLAGEGARRETLERGAMVAVLDPRADFAIGAFGDRTIDREKMQSMMKSMFVTTRGNA